MDNIKTINHTHDWGNFKIFRKKVKELYKDEYSLNLRTGHASLNRDYFRINTKEDFDQLMSRAYNDPVLAAEVSKTLAALDPNYSKVLSYYSNMFLIRHLSIPVQIKKEEEVDSETYMEEYNEMVEVVAGTNLNIIIPKIIKEALISGASYLYAKKNNTSKSTSIILLPRKYCRTVFETNMGTNYIEFDFRYFNNFIGDSLEKVFSTFSKEFKAKYNQYRENPADSWIGLDPKVSTSIISNEMEMPPFINSLKAILEYEKYRDNELEKSDNQLKSLFINEVPVYEGKPLFGLDEAREIQKAISKVVRRHQGLDSITTFGESKLVQLQKETEKENKQIKQSYNTIFNSAGMNSEIFGGDSDKALEINQAVDQAFVWDLVLNINNFLNLSINNLYNFKPFQVEINILKISAYNEENIIKSYRENASFGLGRLDALIASGVKQKHIRDRSRLEQELNLTELLIPLQSSHTQKGGDSTPNENDGEQPEGEVENTSNEERGET